MNEEQIKKLIDARVKEILPEYLKTQAFSERKITDMPTDRLQVTPMGYVNMYSSVASLPASSVIAQQVFVTDLGYPVFKHQNGRWVTATASIVA